MPTKTFEIARHEITLLGQMLTTYDNRAVPVHAIIRCDGPNGEVFEILVTPDWDSLPPYSEITTTHVIGKIVVAPARYAWYVDLIRNEGSILASVDDSSPMKNRLVAS